MDIEVLVLLCCVCACGGFWDAGTTTVRNPRDEDTPRQSFFRWQRAEWETYRTWFHYWDWEDIEDRRCLQSIAGLSIDFLPITVGAILNRRVILTSANPFEPHMNRVKDLRIWALGRAGLHYTPYRYRVWRARRVIPRSLNPEHWHGARLGHQPRHDVLVIHSRDQIYLYSLFPNAYQYPYRTYLVDKKATLTDKLTYAGSGYEYLEHIQENYKIFYGRQFKKYVVNCEKYLPKWWGKFICMVNWWNYAGVPNGGPLSTVQSYQTRNVIGLGCFEIRYNEDRIMVFTDIRYYLDWIHVMANFTYGEYYEYAYPQWSIRLSWFYEGNANTPYIPVWQTQEDHWPLGK